ncbi:MAG: DNA topoisomerase IV subunit B [Rhodospirillaceae bacterium]|nr:DNA topoisomerase IV subunit B [Rhodospirillaceae bacterium]
MKAKATHAKAPPQDQPDLFGAGRPAGAAAKAPPAPAPANDDAPPSEISQTDVTKPSAAKPTDAAKSRKGDYTAADIEVLEGLEPVRRRPGMYIGGTDDRALHHLAAEVLDNAMDEVVAGHASRIEIELREDGYLAIHDNGRGMPVDPHPKFKNVSAVEVIFTTLHSGGKFGGKAYATSGGLHGVGASVVNALAADLTVEVARDGAVWRQTYSRGKPTSKLRKIGEAGRGQRGTTVTFIPDPEIFGKAAAFRAKTLYQMVRAKAYLIKAVELRWKCSAKLLPGDGSVPETETIHFERGIEQYLEEALAGRPTYTVKPFAGTAKFEGEGKVEWAVAWPGDEKGFTHSYVNTVPTPQGGSHETGFRAALTRSLRGYGDLVGNKKSGQVTAEDLMDGACTMLSLFIPNPQFQGQTKERLGMPEAQRVVESVLKDHFDHWLTGDPLSAKKLLDHTIDKAEERQRRRDEKEMARASATRKLRLPGKLADCSERRASGTEIFLVEGDSAGGSAKQARDRKIQAILPLRGKILNVASATADKLRQNQELADLVQALGCGTGSAYDGEKLRYDRVIVMTDADVDGAHIASLLLTFFYREMPRLIREGHLFLAMPPLYRLAQGGTVLYARDDAHKDELMKSAFKGKSKVEISRFKGLGEMPPAQLKETTMDPKKRILLRVVIPSEVDPHEAEDHKATAGLVERLMGRKPELRFEFIQERAKFVEEVDV